MGSISGLNVLGISPSRELGWEGFPILVIGSTRRFRFRNRAPSRFGSSIRSLRFQRVSSESRSPGRLVSDVQCQMRVHFQMMFCRGRRTRGKGLVRLLKHNVPPASEREARMDDPTHRLETAGGNAPLGGSRTGSPRKLQVIKAEKLNSSLHRYARHAQYVSHLSFF
jgi:hypothetical protein